MTALRILCELRLDREDLHNVVEHALHPPKKTKAERKAIAAAEKAGRKLDPEPQMPTMEQMRREPLALDSSGLMYWYLDYHNTTGTPLMPLCLCTQHRELRPRVARQEGPCPCSSCADRALTAASIAKNMSHGFLHVMANSSCHWSSKSCHRTCMSSAAAKS